MAREKDKELTTDDKFELLIAALTARQEQGLTGETLKEILAANSTAVQRALKPENATHPGKSVFSYPEGDEARPKPALPFECFYNGYPVHKFPETEHWRELELFAQVQPGEFTVIRKDGSPMAVTVKGEKDAHGKLTKIAIEFPILREERSLVPPKTVVLYQLVNPGNPKKAFLEAMTEFYQLMMSEPAAV
jgi:hypothetical protein